MRFLSLPQTDAGATLALWPAARQTGNFNAVAGFAYPVDTTSAPITVTLPASPAQGDRIGILDIAGTSNTNAITVGRNGQNIMGLAEDMTIAIRYAAIVMYFDATRGWRVGL
jgi:hypothetical protein